MSTTPRELRSSVTPLQGVILISLVATLVGGCVAQVPVADPPPPRVYVPAPPPAVVEIDVQAYEPPPPLPVYVQPPCPGDGYLWVPGYWHYAPGGYYWVPGTWVLPPRVGVFWTPGYWGSVGGVYVFHAGYWGPHVGFYGGVNYGFGYGGVGFAGGRWVGNSFAYNRSVTNVNVTVVHNTYNETVINNVTVNKVSYNGGAGGITATPTPQERMAAQESHVPPTPMQREHIQQAARNPALFAKTNGGHPSVAATPRPGAFNAPGVVGAHGAMMPPQRVAEARPGSKLAGASPTSGEPSAERTPPQGGQPTTTQALPPKETMHPQTVGGQPPAPKPKAAAKPKAATPKADKPHPETPPEHKKHEAEDREK